MLCPPHPNYRCISSESWAPTREIIMLKRMYWHRLEVSVREYVRKIKVLVKFCSYSNKTLILTEYESTRERRLRELVQKGNERV